MPGVSFLARKRELGYVLNRYSDTYFEAGESKYFPETFLIPEQLEEYKRVHKVGPGDLETQRQDIHQQNQQRKPRYGSQDAL